MKTKKVFILLGHPDNDSLNHMLVEGYEKGAKEVGHEVRRTNVADLVFDPILHRGYRFIQELEPDLKKVQEDVYWCEHFVIFYPTWWSAMPALLKGMFDRMWLPGFAYKYLPNGYLWQKLLKGRTARVFVTSDSHPLLARFVLGDNTNEIKDGILWFAGFNTRVKKIWPVKNISPARKEQWVRKFERYGKKLY